MYILLLIFLTTTSAQDFNIKDVLNPDLLPGSFFLKSPAQDTNMTTNVKVGDIKDAFMTMQYHRSMMNEYLCHNYVADEILSELQNRAGKPQPRIEEEIAPSLKRRRSGFNANDRLLADSGSQNYKQWLSRSATLGDVYRHYDQMESTNDMSQQLQEGDYEGGEVTGYAEQPDPITAEPTPGPIYSPGLGSYAYGGPYVATVSPVNVGQRYGGWEGGGKYGPSFEQGHDYDVKGWYDNDDGHKKMALKDLFNLILTALAFLSFGLFVVNIVLPFILRPAPTTTTISPIRQRRHDTQSNRLNEVAYRVLVSIDKFVELQRHRGSKQKQCLKYSLCQNNKYSRQLNNKDRMLLPIWSFGLSWLSGQVGDSFTMLDNVRASVLGLGNANCEALNLGQYQCGHKMK